MRCVDKCLLSTDQSTDSTEVQFEQMSFIRVTCRNMGRGYLREWLKDSCSTKVRCGIYSSSEKLVTSSPSNRQATKQIGKHLLGSSASLNLFQELSLSESVSKQSLHAIHAWGAMVFVYQVSFRDFLNEAFELSTSWNYGSCIVQAPYSETVPSQPFKCWFTDVCHRTHQTGVA